MTQKNNNQNHKCPYCPCIFLTETDLEKHMSVFGKQKEQHEYEYKKTHGRMEHGFGEE
jgi:Zn-finger nucleic acid-binding protein